MPAVAALLSLCFGALSLCPSYAGPQCSAVLATVKDQRSVSVSPDDKLAAVAGGGSGVLVYNVTTGAAVTAPSLIDPQNPAVGVAFSPDSGKVAVALRHGGVAVVSLSSGTELWSDSSKGYWSDVAYSPDGTHVASAHESGYIRIWDATTGASVSFSQGVDGYLCGLMYTVDGGRLISGSDIGNIYIWNATTGALLKTLLHQSSGVCVVSVSPDGLYFATANQNVQIYNLSDYSFHEEYLHDWVIPPPVSFSRGWSTYVAGASNLVVFSVENGTLLEEYTSTQTLSLSYFHTSDAIISGVAAPHGGMILLWGYVGTLVFPTPSPSTPAPPTPAPATLPPPTPFPPTPAPPTPSPPTPAPPTSSAPTPALVAGLCALAFFVGACLCVGLMRWWQWRRREGSGFLELHTIQQS